MKKEDVIKIMSEDGLNMKKVLSYYRFYYNAPTDDIAEILLSNPDTEKKFLDLIANEVAISMDKGSFQIEWDDYMVYYYG